jgi:endoglucanase
MRTRLTHAWCFAAVLAVLLAPSARARCNDCWLEVSGTDIVNAATGQPVILRAVGLGGWLLQEGYMLNPQGCDGCPGTQWEMKRQYLDEGLTIGQVEAFYEQWRANFITREDIDFIASLGFNSVRLPMHYELFLTEEQRAVRNEVITDLYAGHDRYKDALRGWLDSNELFVDTDVAGVHAIDDLIEWCEANGLYVILDMHAAPGAQGSDRNICDGFHDNNLWQYPVFQDVLVRLWEAISDRYRDEPRIAMYEFINEPNNVPGGGPAIHALTQRLISAVRDNGDNHILGVHGNGWTNAYDFMEPFTFAPNWGLVYNAHRYWIDPADDWVPNGNPNVINRMVDLIAFRDTHNVPVWVGETGENNNAWLTQNIDKLEAAGIGWCHWTYKRHDVWENAALARIGGSYPTDGRFAMQNVLQSIRFERIIPNQNTIAAVTGGLPQPWTTGCSPASGACPPIGRDIWLRGSHGEHVSSQNGDAPMICDRETLSEQEVFTVVDAGDGKIALRGSNGRYVSSENGQQAMRCDRLAVQAWERFDWLDLGNGMIALRGNNDRFVSSNDGQQSMRCDRETIGDWESFTFGVTDPCEIDLAGAPDGLDFFDVLEHLRLFDTGDPAADLAQPLGVLNERDTAEFLARFNAGCP